MPSPTVTPRVRFAPSPTGYLHVGGARTALINWLYARHYGGQFLLRIEDTDKARSTDEHTQVILDGMHWIGLHSDETVVFQGANLARHQAHARQIFEAGAAYRCFCTAAELDERRREADARKEAFVYDRRCDRLPADEVARRVAAGMPHTIRFRVPPGDTSWEDLVHGTITFPNKDVEDFVILRSDGTPIYNLAVVSDDIDMRITLVMRGDEHISNTPKQILLYRALGAPMPQFGHIPLILDTDGKKLSKRRGATAVGDYQHMGILPEAMVNFLALLGWSPGGDREVMTLDEMVELFSTEGLSKKPAVFDVKKLEWMNGQHMIGDPIDQIARHVTPAIVRDGLATEAWLADHRSWYHHLLEVLRVRARTVDDLVRQARPYFVDELQQDQYDADALAKHLKGAAAADILKAARTTLADIPAEGWIPATTESALRTFAEGRGLGAGKVFQPIRVAVTGSAVSPGIGDVLALVGQERALRRIDEAVRHIEEKAAGT
jgi:glutamyl-tRNA synthetase